MSYCRFSSDDFKSDVYCYDDVHGHITVHVAGSRIIGKVYPSPQLISPPHHKLRAEYARYYSKEYKKHLKSVEEAEREDIPEPYAGCTRRFASHEQALDFLLELKQAGIIVPDYAIDAMRDEIGGE